MLKMEKCNEYDVPAVNIRDKIQTKNKNEYNRKIKKNFWLRHYHEKLFLGAVFRHSFEDNGLSIAGIIDYVKSGRFEDDIIEGLIKKEKEENEKNKIAWGNKE